MFAGGETLLLRDEVLDFWHDFRSERSVEETELGRDAADQIALLHRADRREVVPEVEDLVAHQQGLATAKPPAAPVRQRVHERPWPVWQIAVKLLPAALDVE